MCFCLFFFLKKRWLSSCYLGNYKLLTPGKLVAQGRGGTHPKVVITGHLLPALPFLSHLPILSLSYPWLHNSHPSPRVWCDLIRNFCLDPYNWVGCLYQTLRLHQIAWDPFNISVHPSLASWLPSIFPLESFCFLQPIPVTLLQGRCPGPPGRDMYNVWGWMCPPLQQPLANDWQSGSLKAQVLHSCWSEDSNKL